MSDKYEIVDNGDGDTLGYSKQLLSEKPREKMQREHREYWQRRTEMLQRELGAANSSGAAIMVVVGLLYRLDAWWNR